MNNDVNKVQHECICCDNKITKIDGLKHDDDYTGMYGDGLIQKIEAGFGSIHDGDMFYLALCDDCIKSKQKQNKLKYIGNYMFPDVDFY